MDPSNWLPYWSEVLSRRDRPREALTAWEPFAAAYTPAPNILASLTFFPLLPPPQRPLRPVGTRLEIVVPFDVPTVVAPDAWLPLLAGPLPRPARPRIELTMIDPTYGAQLRQAATMSWAPITSAPARPTRSVPTAFSTPSAILTAIPGIIPAIPCVELRDRSIAASALTAQAVTAPDLLAESLAVSRLVSEDLC
jgi:hypothetical protein